MKFKKTVSILLVAFVVAPLTVTAVSTSHSDGVIDDKVAPVTVGRAVRANPGDSF
jgi:hypothetical protein